MNGSGARDGGSPPWGPADPVPDLARHPGDPWPRRARNGRHRYPGASQCPRSSSAAGLLPETPAPGEAAMLAQTPAARDGDGADGPTAEPGAARIRPADAERAGKRAPQLLARASGARRHRAWCSRSSSSPSSSRPSTSRPPRWRTPWKSATGSDQQGRLPPPVDPPRRHRRVRRHRIVGLRHPAGQLQHLQQGGRRARGDRRRQPRLLHLHQARDRPARRPRGLLQRQRPGHRQRRAAQRELLPVPGQRAVHAEVQHHRPGRAACG